MQEREITPSQVNEKRAELVLVDVREPNEWDAGHVEGAIHIPLSQVPQRMNEIPKDRDVVMICRSGGRSGRAQEYLLQNGYSRVQNMTGGMQRWQRDVDSSVRVV